MNKSYIPNCRSNIRLSLTFHALLKTFEEIRLMFLFPIIILVDEIMSKHAGQRYFSAKYTFTIVNSTNKTAKCLAILIN